VTGWRELGWLVERTELDSDNFGVFLVASEQRRTAVRTERPENSNTRIGLRPVYARFALNAQHAPRDRYNRRRFTTGNVLAVSTMAVNREERLSISHIPNFAAETTAYDHVNAPFDGLIGERRTIPAAFSLLSVRWCPNFNLA